MEEYMDYLVNDGKRYYPYTRVEAVINSDGTKFTTWMANMNIHNHDAKYALINHNHDERYSLIDHNHDDVYSNKDHTHNYAGSTTVGGVANSALKLQNPVTVSLSGAVIGSFSFDGTKNSIDVSTAVNHNHDHEYVMLSGNSIMKLDKDSLYGFAIRGSESNTKISFSNGGQNLGYVQFTDSYMQMLFNDNSFKLNGEAVYYNNDKLATVAFVTNALAASGGSVDMGTLTDTFAKINHSHTKADITDMPTVLPSPNAVNIYLNDAADPTYTYAGSDAVNVYLNADTLDYAKSNHTHDYSSTFAAIDHDHEDTYYNINGTNKIKSQYVDIDYPTPEDFTEDGSIPTSVSQLVKAICFNVAPYNNGGTGSSAYIGANYRYSPDSTRVGITQLYMSLGKGENATNLTMMNSGLYYNNQKIFHEGNMGAGSGLDADKLDGKDINNLPYLKGDESFIDMRDSKKTGNVIYNLAGGISVETFEAGESRIRMASSKSDESFMYEITLTAREDNGNAQESFSITVDRKTGMAKVNINGTLTLNGKEITA